jgi:hypothetical protein
MVIDGRRGVKMPKCITLTTRPDTGSIPVASIIKNRLAVWFKDGIIEEV